MTYDETGVEEPLCRGSPQRLCAIREILPVFAVAHNLYEGSGTDIVVIGDNAIVDVVFKFYAADISVYNTQGMAITHHNKAYHRSVNQSRTWLLLA